MAEECEVTIDKVHRRIGHILIPHKHYMLVWGGFMRSDEDFEEYCSPKWIWFYNCITEVWISQATKGSVPFPNSGSSGVVIDHYLYVYGGVEELTIDLWRYGCQLYCLDLNTLTWITVETSGNSPQGIDKAVAWPFNNKFYIFGGYGECSRHEPDNYLFQNDPNDHSPRGWNNLLSIYDPVTSQWEIPETHGISPQPRAAHSVDLSGDKAYIFGGRHLEGRCNDMFVLDLKTLRWTKMHLRDETMEIPEGRSWHSFNFISEKRAILFGGLNNQNSPCGDWWECEIEGNEITWELKGRIVSSKSLIWHKAAASKETKKLLIVGGVITSPYQIQSQSHVDRLHVIPYGPPPLLQLSLQEIAKIAKMDVLLRLKEDRYLPKCLLDLVKSKLQNKLWFSGCNAEQIKVISDQSV